MPAKKKRRLKNGTKATAKPTSQVSVAREPWDRGATGPAMMARESRVEDAIDPEIDPDTGEVKNRNPNGVKRRVFHDMLEVYRSRGWITSRGFEAGKVLRAAWENTKRGGGYLQERVDSTPKPDAAVAMQVDRMSARVGITRKIPSQDHAILMTVVCDALPIGRLREYRGRRHEHGKAHLAAALDRLADRLGT